MKEINIFLEKLMFLAVIGIPIGVFMIFIQSDGRFSFAALATLVVTAVLILSFSILSPLLEIASNTRELRYYLEVISKNTKDIKNLNGSDKVTSTQKSIGRISDSGLSWTSPEINKRDEETTAHEQRMKQVRSGPLYHRYR